MDLFLLSVYDHCKLVINCWEMADLLALFCAILYCDFVAFLCGVLDYMWYMIVSIPDLCLSFLLVQVRLCNKNLFSY